MPFVFLLSERIANRSDGIHEQFIAFYVIMKTCYWYKSRIYTYSAVLPDTVDKIFLSLQWAMNPKEHPLQSDLQTVLMVITSFIYKRTKPFLNLVFSSGSSLD